MCKYCEPLINCPIGEKRLTVLGGDKGRYGMLLEMVMDRYVDYDDIFIHASFVDLDRSWTNVSHDIEYCPICGEKLKRNK